MLVRVAVVLTIIAIGAATIPAAAVGAAPAAAVQPEPVGQVTLLTGDHVTVHRLGPRMLTRITPGPGRADITFLTRQYTDERDAAHLDVLPSDAVPLLEDDRLDPRLFDVAGLLRQRYDDAHRTDLPIIVQGASAGVATRQGGATSSVTLPDVGAVAVKQPKATANQLWRTVIRLSEVDKVWLDGHRRLSLDKSVPQIGAPDAWAAVTVPQPPGAKFVSLQAKATDTAGNTVEQTQIRAYAL